MTPEHLGGAAETGDWNTLTYDVFGYLWIRYDIQSVIDIGCGFGHTVKWFKDLGMPRIVGVEGWDDAVERNVAKDLIIKHDFTTGPVPITEQFDLAWSAEFVEHVEARYLDNIMSAFKLAKYAVITHALPNQGGHHHVNEQTSEYWDDKFRSYGFVQDPAETARLRATDRQKRAWGRKTLMFFRNQSRP